MRLELKLPQRWPNPDPDRAALSFTWDSRTGTVSGADAERVMMLVKSHIGGVSPHRMQPENWPINDPLHNPVEMAALLGYWWILPPELERHYPIIADDTPAGWLN